jgi:hypothetical protein
MTRVADTAMRLQFGVFADQRDAIRGLICRITAAMAWRDLDPAFLLELVLSPGGATANALKAAMR